MKRAHRLTLVPDPTTTSKPQPEDTKPPQKSSGPEQGVTHENRPGRRAA
jgi:hypothetical protein